MAAMLSFISRRSYRTAIYLNIVAILGITSLFGLSAPTSATQVLAASTGSVCPQVTNIYNAGEYPYALDLGDVNGDGKLDLAIANRSYSYISVAFGNGSGGFLPIVSYQVGNLPIYVRFGDINGDGKLDLATANETGNTASILINNGNGTFGTATNYTVGFAPQAVALRDMNEDGFPDLIVTNRDSNTVSILLNKGSGTFYAPVNYSVGPMPIRFDVADINNDGHLDVAVSSAASTRATVLLGNGTGSLGVPSYTSISNSVYGSNAVMLTDLNGDGKSDIIATTGGGNTTSVGFGNGSGGFGSPVEYPVGSDPASIAIGDLDGDGMLDILVSNWFSYYISVLKGNGDGTFQTASNTSIPNGSNYVTIGDLNQDGLIDSVVANHSSGTVTVLLGQPPDLTPPTGSISINQGAAATASPNVTLNLTAQDVGCGVAAMAFSNDGVSFTQFEPYAATRAWPLLPGDGTKTVYVKFKDRGDNVSQPVSATIVLDQTLPTPGAVTINNGAAYTTCAGAIWPAISRLRRRLPSIRCRRAYPSLR
jgi:hypothetical protein